MKKVLLVTAILGTFFLTGCKEEWEEKVMTKQWYKEHPEETNKLSEACLKSGEETPVCAAVRDVKFEESQINATGHKFNFK